MQRGSICHFIQQLSKHFTFTPPDVFQIKLDSKCLDFVNKSCFKTKFEEQTAIETFSFSTSILNFNVFPFCVFYGHVRMTQKSCVSSLLVIDNVAITRVICILEIVLIVLYYIPCCFFFPFNCKGGQYVMLSIQGFISSLFKK